MLTGIQLRPDVAFTGAMFRSRSSVTPGQLGCFAFVVGLFLSVLFAEPVAAVESVHYSSNNFTLCHESSYLNVTSVNRVYQESSRTLNFTIQGVSPISVTSLNAAKTYYAASKTIIQIGFWTAVNEANQFCNDVSCPIVVGVTNISKTINLPSTGLPFGDITIHYQAFTPDNISFTCLDIAPVGYQNPVWREVFIAVPLAFAVFAAIVTVFSIYVTSTDAEQDILIAASNYGIEPSALRLKTPGLFDVLYYAQFIVVTGQLNLKYPQFYPLFTSNFAWSNLLFTPPFIYNIINTIYPSNTTGSPSPSWYQSEPGLSLNKRQMGFGYANNNTHPVTTAGTGMGNFADAVGLDIRGIFLTSLLFYLIILACVIALCFIIWAILELVAVKSVNEKRHRSQIFDFSIGACIRTLTLFYLPLMTLSFYQLMLPAPWYLLLPAALMIVFPLFGLFAWIAFILLRIRPPSVIFSDTTLLLRYGTLYSAFKDDTFAFFIYVLIYKALVGAMVGLFQTSGIAQVVVIIILETLYFVAHWFKVPYSDRSINNLHLAFGVLRIIVSILNVLFVDEANLLDSDKQYIAYAQIFLHCVAFLVLFAVSMKNLLLIVTGMSNDESHENSRLSAGLGLRWMRRRQHGPRFKHVRTHSGGSPLDIPENEVAMAASGGKSAWRRSTADITENIQLQQLHSNRILQPRSSLSMLNSAQDMNFNPLPPPPQPPTHGVPLVDATFNSQTNRPLSAFGPMAFTSDSIDSSTPTGKQSGTSSGSAAWILGGHNREDSTSTTGVATSQADSNTSSNPHHLEIIPASNSTSSGPSDPPLSPTESFYRPSRRSIRKRSGDYGVFRFGSTQRYQARDSQATPRPQDVIRYSATPTTASSSAQRQTMNDIELYQTLGPEGVAALSNSYPTTNSSAGRTPRTSSPGDLHAVSTEHSSTSRHFDDSTNSADTVSFREHDDESQRRWSDHSHSTDTLPGNHTGTTFHITN
ncbi:hypothetical protein INT43_000595 [Umbelopsis isabellina]|uniref:ML-like domain-containing protein n=1 Tax=Mortierella isabellina TaxID=91625 RepID=A0A8H7Q2E3_MORIS|nr:hypothetical protein INT43_000595 [Umbelopsis isabellina]